MGSSRSKRRRMKSNKKSNQPKMAAAVPKERAASTTDAGPMTRNIVVDVAPEDDDEFVRTLVNVKKTQQCLNIRSSPLSRSSKSTANAGPATIESCCPFTVQVPSIEYIFRKYGKYLIASSEAYDSLDTDTYDGEENKMDDTDAVAQNDDSDSDTNDRSLTNTLKKTGPAASSIQNSTCETEDTDDSEAEPSVEPNARKDTSHDDDATASICQRNVRSLKRNIQTSHAPPTVAFSLTADKQKCKTESEVPESMETSTVAALPKRVSLKKNLIHDMMSRLNKRKAPPVDDDEHDVCLVAEVPRGAKNIPVVTIDVNEEEDDEEQIATEEVPSVQEVIQPAHLIKSENVEDELPLAKIASVLGAVALPDQNVEAGSEHDIAMSSDDDREPDDDVLGDPDFDPHGNAKSLDFDWNAKAISKRNSVSETTAPTPPPMVYKSKSGLTYDKSKSGLTCETCSLRFLSTVNYKIHMKEYHNEYNVSEDEEVTEVEPVAPPKRPMPEPRHLQFNCDLCQLPYATAVGLKIHMRQKHKGVRIPAKAAPKRKITEVLLDEEPKETEAALEKVPEPPVQQPVVEKVLYVCSFPNCDLQFSSIQNMKIHKCLGHEFKPNKSVDCILCKAVAMQPRLLLRHFRNSHPGKVDAEGYAEFSRLGYSDSDNSGSVVAIAESSSSVAESRRRDFKCVHCNIYFQWETTLEAHTKEFHPSAAANSVTQNAAEIARSPFLAATLTSTSTATVEPEGIPHAEIISLSDDEEDEEEDDEEIVQPNNPTAAKKTAAESAPSNASNSKSSSVVTICPYCFQSILYKDFPAHVEIHTTKTATKVKKFPCPYSGCNESYNKLQELVAHHKTAHQEKRDPPLPTRKSVPEPVKVPVQNKVVALSSTSTVQTRSRKQVLEVTANHDMVQSPVPVQAEKPKLDLTIQHKIIHSPAATRKPMPELKRLPVAPTPPPPRSPSPASSPGIVGFMCSVCDNFSFPDMESLLRHCAAMHSKKVRPVVPTQAAVESGRILRKQILTRRMAGASMVPHAVTPLTVTPIATLGPKETSYTLSLIDERDPLGFDEPDQMDQSELKVTPLVTINSNTANYAITPIKSESDSQHTPIGVEVIPIISPDLKVSLLRCSVCEVDGFTSQEEVDMHMVTHMEVTPGLEEQETMSMSTFNCELCDTTFDTFEGRNEHYMKFHKLLSGNIPGKCPLCQGVLKQSRNVPRHVKKAHQMLMCIMCPQMFKQEQQHQDHLDLHSAPSRGNAVDKRYQCLECLMTFGATSRILHHYMTLHGGGDKCTCVTCNIQLQRKNLKRHLSLHQREAVGRGAASQQPHLSEAHEYYTEGSADDPLCDSAAMSRQGRSQSTSAQQMGVGDGMLQSDVLSESDPLAVPGQDFDPVHIFQQQTYEPTQFEFEDVTIGEENAEEMVDILGGEWDSMSSTEFEDRSEDARYKSFSDRGMMPCLGEFETSDPPSDPNELPILCGLCPKRFLRRDNREDHIKRVHKNPTSRECAFCGEYYKNAMALVRHINSAHSDQKPRQEYQPRGGKAPGRGRKRSSTTPRPVVHQSVSDPTQCQFCGLTFRGIMDRRKHELIHFPVNGEEEATSSSQSSGQSQVSENVSSAVEDCVAGDFGLTLDDIEVGNVDANNVFMPLEMMMKRQKMMENSVSKGSAYKEVIQGQRSKDPMTSTSTGPIPQSFDEFVALL